MSLKYETNKTNNIDISKINKSSIDQIKSNYIYERNLKFFVHEILNPLNIINNCAELIEPEEESCQKMTSIILDQVQQCSKLSENILYALNHNQYNKVNLCDFLKDIKDKFESNYQIHINLQLKVNCNKFKLKFNKVYLKVILDNLLKNAHQHSQEIYIVLERFFNDEYTVHTTPAFKLSVKNKKCEYKSNKKSNMVGLELIDTMCSRMNIDWNFFEKDNEFEFILFLKDMF